jgi:DNA-directed RNA polymerase specialized sigma24 family protein
MGEPAELGLRALAQRCMQETVRFRAQLDSDPGFCLELWHRALVRGSAEARNTLVECYASAIRSWLYQHRYGPSIVRFEEEDALVDETFVRLFARGDAGDVQVASLPQVLSYPKTCLNYVIIEVWRRESTREQHTAQVPFETASHLASADAEEEAIGRVGAVELWQRIISCTLNEREARLVHLRFQLGLTPQQIVQRFAADYPQGKVEEIYQMLANIRERYERRYPETLPAKRKRASTASKKRTP